MLANKKKTLNITGMMTNKDRKHQKALAGWLAKMENNVG